MGKFKNKRCANKVGRPINLHATLQDDEKKEYSRKATSKSRLTKKLELEELPRCSRVSRSTTPRKVGRPPLNDSAMTPDTLKEHKRRSLSGKRKPMKISGKRRLAANKRWKMRLVFAHTIDDDPESQQPTSEESEEETDEEEKDDRPEEETISERSIRRAKAELNGIIPTNIYDSTKLFILAYRETGSDSELKEQLKAVMNLLSAGNFSYRQLRYHLKKVTSMLNKHKGIKDHLFKQWLGTILQHPVIEACFNKVGIILPPEILPKSLHLAQVSRQIRTQLLSTSTHTPDEQRKLAVQFTIDVAKEGGLQSSHFGDITLLSNIVSCTFKYAKHVLEAIEANTEAELFKKNKRCSSIHFSDWPKEVTKFVLLPENSRAVPGQEQVSIRYGVRHPKYLLMKSKHDIATAFKQLHPDCKFSISTIMREFPQYAVTPTSRDLERNTCPVHANFRRLVKVLNKKLPSLEINSSIPISCRKSVLLTLCQSSAVSLDPLTWPVDCVTGECSNCPSLEINIPAGVPDEEVVYSQWLSKKKQVTIKGELKEKRIFSLYTHTETVAGAITNLKNMMPSLAVHVYTANKQWDAHLTARSKLDLQSIITIEDYQMNLEAVYSENPTSLAYASNKVTVALYPICVEYLNENGELRKGAISFLTDDKLHDHQQVKAFEFRMFEIVREKVRNVKCWKRFSDGCDGQFRSRFVVADLMKACDRFNCSQVSFDYFEANEGKNISDTIGSIVKCAYVRGMHKHEHGVHNVSDVIRIAASELKESTKKFEFFVVEEFGSTERISSRDECKINHIMKMHSLVYANDKVIASQWTCNKCTISFICEDCKKSQSYVTVNDVKFGEEDDTILHGRTYDTDDEGQTDAESDDDETTDSESHDNDDDDDDDDDDEDDESVSPGDIVWGMCGRIWYPAKVCSLTHIPPHLVTSFRNVENKIIVKWYGEDSYSLLKPNKVDRLAENKIDGSRAARSENMQRLYNTALSELLD